MMHASNHPSARRFAARELAMHALIPLQTAREVYEGFDRTFSAHYIGRLRAIERLVELRGTEAGAESYIRRLIADLLSGERSVSSGRRVALDKTLRDLILTLPEPERLGHAATFVMARRISRREAGYRIAATLSTPLTDLLRESYERHGAYDILRAMTRIPGPIAHLAPLLLRELADPSPYSKPYEQARVFGRLIIEDFALACDLQPEHPLAFVWGAGRASDVRATPLVLETLKEPLRRLLAQRDPDGTAEAYIAAEADDVLVSFCVWALGKMGARDILANIVATLDTLLSEPGVPSDGAADTGESA